MLAPVVPPRSHAGSHSDKTAASPRGEQEAGAKRSGRDLHGSPFARGRRLQGSGQNGDRELTPSARERERHRSREETVRSMEGKGAAGDGKVGSEKRGGDRTAAGVGTKVGEILPVGSPPLRPRSPNVIRDIDKGDALASPPHSRGRGRRGSFSDNAKNAPLIARVPANLAHLQLGAGEKQQDRNGPGSGAAAVGEHAEISPPNHKARRPRRLNAFARPPDPSGFVDVGAFAKPPVSSTSAGDHTLPPLAASGSGLSPQRGTGILAGAGGGRTDPHAHIKGGAANPTGSVTTAAAAAAAASAAAAAAVKDIFPQHRRIHVHAAESLAPIDTKDLLGNSKDLLGTNGHRSCDPPSKPIVPFKPRALPSVGGRRGGKALSLQGAQNQATCHSNDDSVAAIAGALQAVGFEPFIPTPAVVDKWAQLLLQQDAPPEEVSRWQQEFHDLEYQRAKRVAVGPSAGAAESGKSGFTYCSRPRSRALVDESAAVPMADLITEPLRFTPRMPELDSKISCDAAVDGGEEAAAVDARTAATAATGRQHVDVTAASTVAAMTAAFLASASDASQDLLIKESRAHGASTTSGGTRRVCEDTLTEDQSGCDAGSTERADTSADGVGWGDEVERDEVGAAAGRHVGAGFLEGRLDSPPLFYSDIRLPSPPLWRGEEAGHECAHGKDAAAPSSLADVVEEGDDVCYWGACGASAGAPEEDGDEDMLSLVYDPILMCYYERTTGRYFQLKEGVASDLYPTLNHV